MDGEGLSHSKATTIARVDRIASGLWAISLQSPDVVVAVAAIPGQRPAVGFLPRRPKPERLPVDVVLQSVRESIQGAALLGIAASPDVVELTVLSGDCTQTVRADRTGLRLAESPTAGLAVVALPVESGACEASSILDLHRRTLADAQRVDARRQIKAALRKLDRRLMAIEDDERRADRCQAEATSAQALVPVAARARRGASVLEGIDYSSGAPVPIAIKIDPARGAREQLEELFADARRMRRGDSVRTQRRQEALQAKTHCSQALTEIEEAPCADEICSLLHRLINAMPAGVRPRGSGAVLNGENLAPSRVPPAVRAREQSLVKHAREYRALDGARILVGRDARSNDVLTRLARPHDVWLHARSVAGSHVIVAVDKNKDVSPETLIDAATLAAHFSDARGEDSVDVSWCECRYVRKPRGAPPGLVTQLKEKVLKLRFESGRLARLLASLA